jgi:HPt (histidine-containing phosphotransfer) domain-containing protein
VPIVALTADAMPGADREYLAIGADDYLSKPYEPKALRAMVKRWTGATSTAEEDPTQATRPGREPILSDERLAMLRRIMAPREFEGFVHAWLDATVERLSRIGDGVGSGNLALAQQNAHDIASTSGNMGAERMSALARSLEHACSAGDGPGARVLAAELSALAAPSFDAIADRFLRRAAVPATA